jgi:hypothetical protein
MSLHFVHLVVRLPEQVLQCVVVCYDKELRATCKVTPPMLYRFAYGRGLQIIGRVVGVATLSWI